MKCGIFHTPFLDPKRNGHQVFEWSIKVAEVCDKAGFADFMIGEHYTVGRENIPAPDLIIAGAIGRTKNIRFAPMAHLLPYHDPATLAIRIGWLSQVCQGRYFLGVAPGGWKSDAVLHGYEDTAQLRTPMLEALEIMEKVWKREPFKFTGEHFKAGFPTAADMLTIDEPIAENGPFGGRENLEIATTALSFNSPSIVFAGERDYSPISFYGGLDQLTKHWVDWSTAMEKAGRVAERSRYRVTCDIFVADTDAEAKKRAINGGLGKAYSYLLPVYKKFGLLDRVAKDTGIDIHVDDIDMDFMADHVWLVGSPETVAEKIQHMCEVSGGFGQIVTQSFDYIDNPEPWFESLERLAQEVLPKIK
jgi:alkanesulfonate monooxygenase SsuD/methylene tetrahydromethanopterin reductase-like flavin-dependent oxidoreductase (luciferase family)